ncbi:hypothetical protein BDQ17DRAFT_1357071 [Cyathus striatus]|nr:hypothetical protein BDQ17DRAFT_1357071 [Cyathus striatus]
MPTKLRFTQLDVFTATQFLGNPLAIVHLPPGAPKPTQAQKQLIAREFNLSETVFLHENSKDDENTPVQIDIFTTTEELPFAGHPTVGTGWYLWKTKKSEDIVKLKTKAGEIPVSKEGGRVRLNVPINFKVHESYAHPELKKFQPGVAPGGYINGAEGKEAVASIVKGMTFVLLQLSSLEALSTLQPLPKRISVPDLGEWEGFVGVYSFFEAPDGVVYTRMFDGALEDPATGSAASTLGGWLGKKKGAGKWKFDIVQGVDMGRRSEIEVIVEVGSNGEVKGIELGGGAVEVMEGWVSV